MTRIDHDCKAFVAFCEANPDKWEDLLERIIDAFCSQQKTDGICFDVIHQHNACNHTMDGSIDIEGKTYRFTIDNGDWAGTVVREWGDEETVGLYTPPPPPQYDMVPIDPSLKATRPSLWKVYLAWRKEPWFAEIIRSYAYDKHFAPGGRTETYYRDKAQSKGLRIVSKEYAQEVINDASK
jgi:hypothetical protein